MLFQLVAVRDAVTVGPGEETSLLARACGGTGIICWVLVLFWGRMLPFIGQAF